jgi:hypothetical protein
MNRFVQIIGRQLGVQIGPECFHSLIAVNLMMRLKCQQLDEQRRLATREAAFFYRLPIHHYAELAQQVYL